MAVPAFRRRRTCELCGSSQARTLIRRPLADPGIAAFLDRYYSGRVPEEVLRRGSYEVARCADCGFLWQTEVLDDAGLALLYEEWIDPTASLRVKTEADPGMLAGYARQIELMLRLRGKAAAETSALDFGMGWGHWCRLARAYRIDACGLEPSARRREHAASLGVPTVEGLDRVADESVDLLNAEQVFEHVPEPLALLREAVRTLRPGAIVRLSVPNATAAARRLASPHWSPRKDALQPLEHINGFTHRTLRRLAEEAGLRPLPQPFLPGQGLLGKSYRPGAAAWLKSLLGVPYRALWGTTAWFRKPGG